ncbi:hypothetical protein NMQ03_09070 [Arthrobacter sp. DNA4]|nr:hypothetical protein [Arthrobacter sp. DNA4]UTT71207.1 hypothetical protein NMQ03_09070 [Arthrobacter sp. DNA4]
MEMEPDSMHGHLDHPHTGPAKHSVEQMLAWLRGAAGTAAPGSQSPVHH